MKFGENLQYYATAEWRDKYIDYEKLKNILEEAQSTDYVGDDEKEKVKSKKLETPGQEIFFREVYDQLEKVNHFYNERYSKVVQTFNGLKKDVELYKNPNEETSKEDSLYSHVRNRFGNSAQKVAIQPKSLKVLKANFSDFYLSLVLIDRYQKINFDGFRKILKKFDKNMHSTYGDTWRKKHIEKERSFYTNKQMPNLLLQTETIVADDLEGGDRKRARKKLGVPSLESTDVGQSKDDFTLFRVGLFLGMGIVFLSAIVLSVLPVSDCLFSSNSTSNANSSSELSFLCDEKDYIIRLYRPGIVLAFLIFLLGFNVYGWRKAGVNHVLIFEIDYREHLAPTHLWEISFVMALTWLASILAFIHDPIQFIPRYAHPVIYYIFLACLFIFPIPIPGLGCYRKARSWLMGRFWRLLFPGYWTVSFADFWLADQLTSMAGFFLDIEYLACFYILDGSIADGPKECTLDNITYTSTSRNINETLVETACQCGKLVGGSTFSGWLRVLLMMWPAMIRFLQCIRRYFDSKKIHPHITNAGKYSTTFLKVLVAYCYLYYTLNVPDGDYEPVLRILLHFSTAFSSFYSLVWDIKMDWGFFDQKDGDENSFCSCSLLRDHLVYSGVLNWKYYAALIEDIVFRFLWILSSMLGPSFLTMAEIFRRFVWNFFRLENEHLNNCGEFRAVRDITVTQHRKEDLERIEDMMDDNKGPKHRRHPTDSNSNPTAPEIEIDERKPLLS